MDKTINRFLSVKAQKIIKVENRKTNVQMNLIKALAIIAVVASHTEYGGIIFPMDNWIGPYFIFMPIFVFVSGYFYRKETDETSIIKFITQKVKTLLVPYFVWNLIYGILNVVIRDLGIVEYGRDITFESLFVIPWTTGHQFAFIIPAWFLLSLFIISVVLFMLRKVLYKLHILNEEILLIICFAVSMMTIHFAEEGYNTGWYLCFAKAGFMLPYFQLGFVYKKHEKILNKRKGITLSVLFILLYVFFVLSEGVANVQVVFANFKGDPFIISMLEIIQILIVATVCHCLVPAFENNKIVRYIGDNTFTIMMHHGLVVFLINFGLYIVTFFTDLASFDIEKFKSTLWYCYPWRDDRIYLLYVAMGIAVPLIAKKVIDKIVIKLYEKQKSKKTLEEI